MVTGQVSVFYRKCCQICGAVFEIPWSLIRYHWITTGANIWRSNGHVCWII